MLYIVLIGIILYWFNSYVFLYIDEMPHIRKGIKINKKDMYIVLVFGFPFIWIALLVYIGSRALKQVCKLFSDK